MIFSFQLFVDPNPNILWLTLKSYPSRSASQSPRGASGPLFQSGGLLHPRDGDRREPEATGLFDYLDSYPKRCPQSRGGFAELFERLGGSSMISRARTSGSRRLQILQALVSEPQDVELALSRVKTQPVPISSSQRFFVSRYKSTPCSCTDRFNVTQEASNK